MLKAKFGATILTLSFPGISPDAFCYMEHKNHGISLPDGTSATEELQGIMDDFVNLQKNGKGHSIVTQKKITSVKQALLVSSAEQTESLNAILADGRAFQEKELVVMEHISAAIVDINNLLTWAKVYDDEGDGSKAPPELEIKVKVETAPVLATPEHNWIDSLIADLMPAGGCCGFCDRDLGGDEEAQLEEVEKATSGKRLPTLQEYMQESIDAAQPPRFKRLLEEMKAEMRADPNAADPSIVPKYLARMMAELKEEQKAKEARPDIVGDFMRGMFGRSDIKTPKFNLPENTFKPQPSNDAAQLKKDILADIASGNGRVIRVGSIDELAKVLGIDKDHIQLVPINDDSKIMRGTVASHRRA